MIPVKFSQSSQRDLNEIAAYMHATILSAL